MGKNNQPTGLPVYKGAKTDVVACAAALKRDESLFEPELQELESQLSDSTDTYNQAVYDLEHLDEVRRPYEPESHIKETAGWTFSISGVVVAVLFVFHIVIWIINIIFNIPWDTCGWTKHAFFWGLGLSSLATGIAALIYGIQMRKYESDLQRYYEYVATVKQLNETIEATDEEIDKYQKKIDTLWTVRKKALGFAIRSCHGLPFPDHLLPEDWYNAAKSRYFELTDHKDKLLSLSGQKGWEKQNTEYVDMKLKFFYDFSMPLEVSNENVFKEFKAQMDSSKKQQNLNILRSDHNDEKSHGRSIIRQFGTFRRELLDNRIERHLDSFQEIKNRKTSKLLIFTDTEKKAAQSSAMGRVVSSARQEYEELRKIGQQIEYALSYARGCAYRNLYLGVELLNYIRANAGGSSLTTVQDTINTIDIPKQMLSYSHDEMVAHTGDVALMEMNRLSSLTDGLDDTTVMAFVSKNPKISAAIAAFELASSAIHVLDNHFSAVEKNAEYQKNLASELDEIVSAYTEGQGQMLRAIEIIQSIVKANTGFMAIYEPMKKKVFEANDIAGVSKQELIQLAAAMKEYKSISDSKL